MWLAVAACWVAVGGFVGWVVGYQQASDKVHQIVAMSWGDGKYGPAFYGTEVYLNPIDEGFSVRGRVWIGRGNPMYHDIGELGVVQNAEDATKKWGDITWSDAGLTIGPGDPMPYFLSRQKLESHR
jgi:hypothetical protein